MELNDVNLLEQLTNISVAEEVIVVQPMEQAPSSLLEDVQLSGLDLDALQQLINVQMEAARQKMLEGAAQQQELQKLQAVVSQIQGSNNAEPAEVKVEDDDTGVVADQTTDSALATTNDSYETSEMVCIQDDDHCYAQRDSAIKEEELIPEPVVKKITKDKKIKEKKTKEKINEEKINEKKSDGLAERLERTSRTRRLPLRYATEIGSSRSVSQTLCINETDLNEEGTDEQILVDGQTMLIAESVDQQQQVKVEPSKKTQLKKMESFPNSFKSTRIKLGLSPEEVAEALHAQCGATFVPQTITRFETRSLNAKDMCKMKVLLTEWLKTVETSLRPPQTPPNSNNPSKNVGKSKDLPRMSEIQQNNVKKPNSSKNVEATPRPPHPLPNFNKVSKNIEKSNDTTGLKKSVTDALELLFRKNNWPTLADIATYANQLNSDGQAIRTWFRNKRMRDDYPTVILEEIDDLETSSVDEKVINDQSLNEKEQNFAIPTTMSMAARLCTMNEQELEEFLDNSETDAPSIASKILTMNEAELTEFIAATSSALKEISSPFKINL